VEPNKPVPRLAHAAHGVLGPARIVLEIELETVFVIGRTPRVQTHMLDVVPGTLGPWQQPANRVLPPDIAQEIAVAKSPLPPKIKLPTPSHALVPHGVLGAARTVPEIELETVSVIGRTAKVQTHMLDVVPGTLGPLQQPANRILARDIAQEIVAAKSLLPPKIKLPTTSNATVTHGVLGAARTVAQIDFDTGPVIGRTAKVQPHMLDVVPGTFGPLEQPANRILARDIAQEIAAAKSPLPPKIKLLTPSNATVTHGLLGAARPVPEIDFDTGSVIGRTAKVQAHMLDVVPGTLGAFQHPANRVLLPDIAQEIEAAKSTLPPKIKLLTPSNVIRILGIIGRVATIRRITAMESSIVPDIRIGRIRNLIPKLADTGIIGVVGEAAPRGVVEAADTDIEIAKFITSQTL
jgi:hypothetical protein